MKTAAFSLAVVSLLFLAPATSHADAGGGGAAPGGSISDDGLGVDVDVPGVTAPPPKPPTPTGPPSIPLAPPVGCTLPDGSPGVWMLPSGVLIRNNTNANLPPGATCVPVPPPDGPPVIDIVSLTDQELTDLVPWPSATIVMTPGDARALVGLEMGLYATGDTDIAVTITTTTVNGPVTVTGTAQAIAWRWDPGDTIGDNGPATSTSPGSADQEATWHVWPVAGQRVITVTVTWSAELTVVYPGGVTEQRSLGAIEVTSNRAIQVWEAEAINTNP